MSLIVCGEGQNVSGAKGEQSSEWFAHQTSWGSILFSCEVGSTNEWAKELAMYGACEGTVVIVETQTRGRGRLDREWIFPTGGLWISLVFRPKLRPTETVKLTFAAGLAVTKVLREMLGLIP